MADAKLSLGIIQGGFVVHDDANAPVLGLLQADFETMLSKDGTHEAAVVTITEVGHGRYHYSFSATSNGEYFLVIRSSAENPRGWSEDIVIGSITQYRRRGGVAGKVEKDREQRFKFRLQGRIIKLSARATLPPLRARAKLSKERSVRAFAEASWIAATASIKAERGLSARAEVGEPCVAVGPIKREVSLQASSGGYLAAEREREDLELLGLNEFLEVS